MLGSCCFDVKAQAIVQAEVVMCLALVSTDGSVCLAWGMLFVAVAEGRLWIMGLGGFGLWWRRNDTIGNVMKVVFHMFMGALVLGVGVDTKGSMMMTVAMVVANALCG
jgi:hypothetical protein